MIMICSVIGDLTERLAQHDDYGYFDARKQLYPGLSRLVFQGNSFILVFQGNWSLKANLQSTPLVLWAAQPTHHGTQTDA